MADMSLDSVTQNYMDVLKEIGNIGAGNAMTALSQMLQCNCLLYTSPSPRD